jgi:hypothetical protein
MEVIFMVLGNNMFSELNEMEQTQIDGGIGILGALALGAAAYIVYEVVDAAVNRATGDPISDHISDAVGSGISAVGSGLNYLGDAISGN